MGIQTRPEIAPRFYSISSPPGLDYLEIIYNPVPLGLLTTELVTLMPGDSLWVEPPRGTFSDSPDRPAWWIANGTGVAPFLSMFRAGWTVNKTLVQGARYADDLYGKEYLEQAGPEFKWLPFCSTGEAVNTIRKGRFSVWLEKEAELPLDCRYFLCGSEQMIIEVRRILQTRGINFQQILSEIYF